MADEVINLLIRDACDSFYATSPQAPGLIYGRSTLQALREGLDEALAFHFDRPGPFDVREHYEHHVDIDGHELVVRVAADGRTDERVIVRERLARALAVRGRRASLLAQPVNTAGEIVYMCAVPTDTLAWVRGQLDPRGDTATFVLAIADEFLWSSRLGRGVGAGRMVWRRRHHNSRRAEPADADPRAAPQRQPRSGRAGPKDLLAELSEIRPVSGVPAEAA